MTKRTYYTLIVRDDKDSPWGIHFGDYDRLCVKDEQNDIVDSEEYTRGNTKIFGSDDDQESINSMLAAFNTKGA